MIVRNPNPTTPRKQLRAFYARQGLTGKQLRSAMRYDLRQVRKHTVDQCGKSLRGYHGGHLTDAQVYAHCLRHGSGIQGMFTFAFTKEGSLYWAARSLCL